jgi:hypothetical protein
MKQQMVMLCRTQTHYAQFASRHNQTNGQGRNCRVVQGATSPINSLSILRYNSLPQLTCYSGTTAKALLLRTSSSSIT